MSLDKGSLRLLALDVDGTMLNDGGELSSRTRRTLLRLRDYGVELTLATGRLYFGVRPLIDELEIRLPIITSNGARLTDPVTDQVLEEHRIANEVAREVLAYGEQYFPGDLFVNDADGFWIDEKNSLLQHRDPHPAVVRRIRQSKVLRSLSRELEVSPLKISFITRTGADMAELAAQMARHFGSVVEITPSSETSLDVNARGVSKGRALHNLVTRLGIPVSLTAAAGNAENDVEMLRLAGLGLAVANAPMAVQQAADCVIGSNNAEGVAAFFESWYGLGRGGK